MEEDPKMKYACKLCNKSFPCGRSLGGHMRSHVINSPEFDHEKKLSSTLDNGGTNALTEMGYGLRENPKKSSKFSDLSEDTSLHYRVCKECGKGFQSWKALFGHMKCHSVKFSHRVDDEDEDSWTSANHKVNIYSGCENEIGVPSRKKRSSRAIKRYMATATNSSSFSINANNASPSISEIEQEEEVAMCLMMLSRDTCLNSAAESSDNNSEFLSARTDVIISKIEVNNSETEKLKQSEEHEFHVGKNLIFNQDQELGSKKFNQNKRNGLHLLDPEEIYEKKSKFQCTTCNKTFHSYQALGGHRASHKKLKGCFSSKINGEEYNNNNTRHPNQISSNPTTDNYYNDNQETGVVSKKNRSHECPICFRVFSSGQALGGHKRSHLIGVTLNNDAKSKQNGTEIEKPLKKCRDFLDLNMPAPIEEESSTTSTTTITNNSGGVGFKPWWVGSNNKHDPLLGLLLQ